jgi:kinesin family member 11
MATRRQNGRVGSSAMPPPSTRVRPGASTSKGLSSRRPSVAPSVEDSNQGSGITIPIAPRKKGESGEHNIRVVIRCRRRSEREVSDNSPIVVSSIGAKSTEINVETTPPTSTLGVVTPSQTRTYPFDIVFGPEADQSLVYQEVVAPMLDEVLQGYNCTLFAYGQTGTGKTYVVILSFHPSHDA